MVVEGRKRRTRTFYRYAAIYFVVLFLLSGLVVFGVLRYSAGRLVQQEMQLAENNMVQVAESLEKQYQAMEHITVQISMAADYLPSMIERGPTYDLELLKQFKQYTNFSPLTQQYFLLYRSPNRLYTSEGYTAQFTYYAPQHLLIQPDQVETVRQQILSATQPSVQRLGTLTLMVFPVQFHGLDMTGAYDAALCFMLPDEQIRSYISQVSIGMHGPFVIEIGGSEMYTTSKLSIEEMRADMHFMQVYSPRSRIVISAKPDLQGWKLLAAHGNVLMYTGAALLLVAGVLLLAWVMAYFSLLPLEKLLNKYTGTRERMENDFRQLDLIMSDMEQQHMSSRKQLRNHLLLMMLRGEYSERLMARWEMLNIRLDKPICRVFLIEHGAGNDCRCALVNALEHQKNPGVVCYTAETDEYDHLIVIANYADTGMDEEVERIATGAAERQGLRCFVGKVVDSPKRLSLSIMAAITASRMGQTSTRETVSADMLAEAMLSAAKSDNEAMQDRTDASVKDYLTGDSMERFLTRQRFYELVGGIFRKAEERGIELPKTEINALGLVADVNILISDLNKILKESVSTVQPVKAVSDDTARLIVDYVVANAFDPDINLQDMSERFGLSTDYISAMIKRETGIAFKEYLTLLRISEARRLLMEDKSLTINSVAAQVGYRKASNFSKKFKELTGMLPSQLR